MTRIFSLTFSNKYNTYNLILRLMDYEIHVYQAKRRQRIIKNILFHTTTITYTTQFYKSYIQITKRTNTKRTTKTTTSLTNIDQLGTFHPSLILYISSIPKYLYLVCSTISYISPIPTWICYLLSNKPKLLNTEIKKVLMRQNFGVN